MNRKQIIDELVRAQYPHTAESTSGCQMFRAELEEQSDEWLKIAIKSLFYGRADRAEALRRLTEENES